MNSNRETVEKIISLEWDMFESLLNVYPRAQNQDEFAVFSELRAVQYDAWSQAAAESYLNDLTLATEAGRNLIKEKKIHFMTSIAPGEYEILMHGIPRISEHVFDLAREINDVLLEEIRELNEAYPYLSSYTRPLKSSLDTLRNVSSETYLLSELLTYSESTLNLLKEHISELADSGSGLERKTLENMSHYCGCASLDEAEEAAKARINETDRPSSNGCTTCTY